MRKIVTRAHRHARVPVVVAALIVAGALASVGSAQAAKPTAPQSSDNWTMFHYDQGRQGYDPDAAPAGRSLKAGWQTDLDGAVYAEPLVVDDQILAVTENDTLYALSTSGDVLWSVHVGEPVPKDELPCANIDPLGITSTPIYSADTGDVYFAAEVDHPIRHELFAVDLATHAVVWSRSIDPPGMRVKYQQQRAGLAIAQGKVWAGFGALAGICGPYHGWLVGYPLDGQGDPSVYESPSERGASIWGPSGPAVGANGHAYITTGAGQASKPPYDFSNAVIDLDDATEVDYFAPKRWAQFNTHDQDLGSLGPLMFNAFGEDLVYQTGKAGTSYLLRQDDLGGIGGQLASIKGCRAWGSDAFYDNVLYVSCHKYLIAYQVLPGPALQRLWINRDPGYGAGPVVGGGYVWSAFESRIWQIDPVTGKTVSSAPTGSLLPHFATPTLHDNLVIVGTMSGVTAVQTH